MKIEVLGAYGGESLGSRMTCLLIEDKIALDAGSLSQALPIERQLEVEAIVLSHSHTDHTCSIPFFVENVFPRRDEPLGVHTSSATIFAIRKYLFNDATWPDFTRLPNHLLPALRFEAIGDEQTFELHGIRFTPIRVDHLVATHGFLIDDGESSVLWSSDTGPTQRLWEIANQTPNLKAVCLETSFHSALQPIADVSYHLTPKTLDAELDKLAQSVPVLLHHLKPPCVDEIRAEVKRLRRPEIDFLEQGKVYRF